MFVWVDVDENVEGARRRTPARGDASELQLHFEVRDTGMGIPKDKQRIIFEAFAQADGSTTRKYEGTGLGLTISSRLVELMNGRVWVESEVGRGEHVPLHGAFLGSDEDRRGCHRASRVSRGPRVSWSWMTTGPAASILGELLRELGLRADGGRTAVDAALEAAAGAATAGRPFDLLLIDAAMPDMDGFALAHALRQRGSQAPVVMMLTTAGRRSARANDRELRIAAYVTKPIKTGDLLAVIVRSLGAELRRDEAPARPDPGTITRCGAPRCASCSPRTT